MANHVQMSYILTEFYYTALLDIERAMLKSTFPFSAVNLDLCTYSHAVCYILVFKYFNLFDRIALLIL